MRLLGSAVRLAAATVLVAAVGLALPAGPASAATCSSGDGVSVVVDFHELGGGVQTACVADGGGRSGTALFAAAGFTLTNVARQPGFVCRVNGLPANDPCQNTPPADAYWGLFWSDGRSGSWTYATTAAGGLTVPDGGYVAFSWNGSAARSTPGVSPTAHASRPTPTPSAQPTSKPSTKPSSKPSATKQPTSGATSPEPSSAASSSAKPSSVEPSPSGTESATPSASPTKEQSGKAGQPTKPPGGVDGEMLPESDAPAPVASEPVGSEDGGLPTWVGPVVVVALFAAGGAVAVVRRRRNPTP